MKLASSMAVAVLAATGLVAVANSARAQKLPTSTVSTTSAVTLKTFTPVDSLFVNPTVTQFTITLRNTVSGSPTEYRVSRFADFRDANWIPYSAQPTLVVPRSWFPTATGGASEISLYLQVRAKNPLGGRPASLVDGKMTVQPDFFFSEVLGRRIRTLFVG
jgi:membrane-bound inhibitor of C-type lysozyme